MKKRIHRILSLLLLLALLLGMLPAGGATRAYATETETVAAETEESAEVPAVTEESTTEPEAEEAQATAPEDSPEPDVSEKEESEESEPLEETAPPDEAEPFQEDKPPRDPATGYGRPTGTVEELEAIPVPDEILADSYSLLIPVILYGTTTISVSFKYPGDPNQTTYTFRLGGFKYHYLNGQMAYCVEPQASTASGTIYSQIAGGAEINVWDRFLSDSQRNAIALALAYGAPNGLNSSTKLTLHGYEAATQVIIWELIIGYRNTVAPFNCTDSGLYDHVLSLCNPNDSTGTLRAAYINGYNSIISSMQSHGVIPSFASKKQAQAPEYEMAYDAASGLYRIVLTDSNNAIINDFPYTGGNGLTFTKSENHLTVTATAEALRNQPILVSATGSDPDTDNVSPVIWGTQKSNHREGQILSQLAKPEPVHVYFKLKAPSKTGLTIQKVCEDGNISGITFTVTDSGGSVLFSGQTDQNGRLNAPDLEVGKTVTVTETVPENYVCENRVQTVTLAAGSNTVTFRNIPLGTATMNKVSDGGDVDGYCFRLYRFEGNGNSSRTWCGKSDTDGRIYETGRDFILLGGEKSFVFTGLTDGKYSFRELLSLHGAGNVWPESITFTTSGGTTLACNLSFTGEQLVAQENGDCTVSGIELTGLDGGGTLTITIKNEPVPMGSITVRKVDESGKAMKGVSFLLEYSTDGGSAWTPVTSRGEIEPMTPGSCTSAGLKNGKLVTGSDGLAAFTGLCVETDSGPILYRLTETATRPGYSLLAGPAFDGPLPEGEVHDVTLTAVNMPEFQMPMTGGRGFGFTTVGVFVSLLSATALLFLLWKKRRNESI